MIPSPDDVSSGFFMPATRGIVLLRRKVIQMVIVLKDVEKTYRAKGSEYTALKGISFTFPSTGLVCILGPSGCGKTTLLNLMGALDQPTKGEILVDGKNLASFTSKECDAYRNQRVGFIFQDYNLISGMSCADNIRTALEISNTPRSEREHTIEEVMDAVGVRNLCDRLPNQISGGQRQRVSIARAIATNPDLLLADEPTGALDLKRGKEILQILKRESQKRLVVIVTHNESLANEYADSIINIEDGRIKSISEKAELNHTAKGDSKPVNAKQKIGLGLFRSFRMGIQRIREGIGRFLALSLSISFGIFFLMFTLSLSNGFNRYVERVSRQTGSMMSYSVPSYIAHSKSDEWQKYNQSEDYPSGDLIYPYYQADNLVSYQYNHFDPHYISFLEQLKKDEVLSDYVINYAGNASMIMLTSQPGKISDNTGAGTVEVDTTRTASMAPGTGGMNFAPTSIVHTLFGNYEQDYDVLSGRLPKDDSEGVLIVDKRNSISFDTLKSLGFYNNQDTKQDILDASGKVQGFDFEVALGKEYRIYSLDDYYQLVNTVAVTDGLGESHSLDLFSSAYLSSEGQDTQEKLDNYYADHTPFKSLKIVGIIRPNKSIANPSMRTGLAYLPSLMEDIVEVNRSSKVSTSFEKSLIVRENSSLGDMVSDLEKAISEAEQGDDDSISLTPIKDVLDKYLYGAVTVADSYYQNKDVLYAYTTLAGFYRAASIYGAQMISDDMSFTSFSSVDDLKPYIQKLTALYTEGKVEQAYSLLTSLCGILNAYSTISSITLLPSSMENSTKLAEILEDYNNIEVGSVYHAQSEEGKIYTIDYVSWAISDVGTAIDLGSTLLIVLSVISLLAAVVIGAAVTNMSVMERTREIGILRAIGAKKSDVCVIFESESMLAGICGAVMGSLLAYVTTFPVNAIINYYYSVYSMDSIASMAWWAPLIALPIAVLISCVSALIPSLKAANKDPVICLKSNE